MGQRYPWRNTSGNRQTLTLLTCRYENAELSPLETDLLSFWKCNSVNYPILAAMAKDYLTIQSSSVSSERAFSSGTDLVTADRCSLSGKTIEMTQFLKFSD
jgi:hypothetical protein